MASTEELERDFHHPYTPYDIQLQFMRALYSNLEDGKIGIFESPTGTGKSLSLICGSLTWLRDHKRKNFSETIDDGSLSDDEPDWMLEYSRRERSRVLIERRKELEERLARVRAAERKQHERYAAGRANKTPRLGGSSRKPDPSDEREFELDDYNSDDEDGKTTSHPASGNADGLSVGTLALLEQLKGPTASAGTADSDKDDGVKIFYCSRTHSQLTQFAHELRRVALSFPPSMPLGAGSGNTDPSTEEAGIEEGVKHLSLGSRKNLCINPKVSSLGNPTAINERCLDLQKSGVAAEEKCPFIPSKDNESLVNKFRDHTLATVSDIEDIGKFGKDHDICAYYASRSVIEHSEIITLPYQLLLQKSAREALNFSVKGHVVIIDEAHNLMDTISSIHSATVSLSQLRTAISQLTMYARKYKNRLKGKNRVYVTQVIRLVSSVADHLQRISDKKSPPEGSVLPSDLMAGKGVDQINPHKLSHYLHESKLARKVDGFVEHSQKQDNGQAQNPNSSVPVLFHVQSFLLPLMNPTSEGQMFFAKVDKDVQLKYTLLDPTNHFREIVEDARAVILAGGTMSPMGDYMNHLFSYVPQERLSTSSYGYVIPRENLTVIPIVKGILNSDFDFTYEKRGTTKIMVDLGRTLAALCRTIPDGVVAFFPSYDYLNQVLNAWKQPDSEMSGRSIVNLIEKNKVMFYESQDKQPNTEDLLHEYSTTIDSGKGALLLSVVGGKLSEGINFSDKLGRGVVIIGLPFPNIRSAVWQAKIQHIEGKAYERSSGSEENKRASSKTAGKDFYENACMRAVNQCIGRAIRHQNDYAAIMLIDRRYDTERIQSKLPAWIRQSLAPDASSRATGNTMNDLSAFFRTRRSSYIDLNESKTSK